MWLKHCHFNTTEQVFFLFFFFALEQQVSFIFSFYTQCFYTLRKPPLNYNITNSNTVAASFYYTVSNKKSLKKEICSGCLIWMCWSKVNSVRAICNIFDTMHRSCIITEDSKTINLTKELLVKLLWICQSMKSMSLYNKVTKFIIFDKCKHFCGFAQETHLNLPF